MRTAANIVQQIIEFDIFDETLQNEDEESDSSSSEATTDAYLSVLNRTLRKNTSRVPLRNNSKVRSSAEDGWKSLQSSIKEIDLSEIAIGTPIPIGTGQPTGLSLSASTSLKSNSGLDFRMRNQSSSFGD